MDEEPRRELLARRDRDQRIRAVMSSPQGQHMVQLPDDVAAEWRRIDAENTRWLGEVLQNMWPPRKSSIREPGMPACIRSARSTGMDLSRWPCRIRAGARMSPSWSVAS